MSVAQALALAQQYYEAGHWHQAEQIFLQILQVDPTQVDVLSVLGIIALQTGRGAQAVDYFGAVLRLRPQEVAAHNNLGLAFHNQGRFDEAVLCYEQVLCLTPDDAEAHNNLGNSLLAQGKEAEAAASYQQALQLQPNYAEAHNNLGNILRQRGDLVDAVAHLERAVKLRPDLAQAHFNLGNALQDLGELTQAMLTFEEALRRKPDFAHAHYNLSLIQLLLGDYERGWSEYEWRWQTPDFHPLPLQQPLWDGAPLGAKTILLHTEQGLGDTFQLIRYAPLVKERGGTILTVCSPELLGVLSGCPGIDRLLTSEDTLPAYDVHAPLMSLPLLCGTTLANIPAAVPYLVVDAERVGRFRKQLAEASGLKVGLCWQGNPAYKNDRLRSAPLAEFGPLAEVPGVHLVCLQKGPGQEQWDSIVGKWPTVDLPARVAEPSEGWVDTAALISALDLVITVDTAVAHLAGALGVPVWVALPFRGDWRWLLGREDSPWYPSMRLFRQTECGDWAGVFQRIKDAVHARVEAAHSGENMSLMHHRGHRP
jgi:Flp pilus assembly protein TadD